MTDFSITREQSPVAQQFEITVILPRNYTDGILELIRKEVKEIFSNAEGISPRYGMMFMEIGTMNCGVRKQRVIMMTQVHSTANMVQQQQLNNDLASLLIKCGASKIEITMERIER